MQKLILLLFSGLLLAGYTKAQNSTQTIRGTVVDKQAQYNLPGVNVVIINYSSFKGTVTDADGKFKIPDVIS